MADANSAVEHLKILTDLGKGDSTLELMRMQGDLTALASQAQQARDAQPTQAQSKAAFEAQQTQEGIVSSGTSVLNKAYERLGLSEDQGYLSQMSGELSATLRYQLQQDFDKANSRESGSEKAAILGSAIQQLEQYADGFRAQNPDAVDFRSIAPERAKDLASADGFWGVVAKGAATAVAGIPGLAGIAASSLATNEDSALGQLGQTLGGAAAKVQSIPGTDIGSSAASQEFGDVLARAESGEISTGEAVLEGLGSLGDLDFVGDLAANTVGAAAGGGALRAGARLATGAGATAARAAPSGVLGNAAQAAPAIGVGLGAGVDDNLTPGQARLLLGTGIASAGFAGAAPLIGGQVAESALGNIARATPGLRGLAGGAAGATDDLAQVGLRGQAAAGLRGAGSTAIGEAPQEFIEGAGESLGQSAQTSGQGALATLADPEARQRAITSGAVQAPLGAALGAAIGAPSGVSTARQQDSANREALGALETEAQGIDTERTSGIKGADIADQIEAQRIQSQLNTTPISVREQQEQVRQAEGQAIAQDDNFEAAQAKEANVEAIRSTLVNEIPAQPLAPEQLASSTRAQRQAANQPTQKSIGLIDYLSTTLDNPAQFDALVDQGQDAVDNTFRALYRNELEQQGPDSGLRADAEDAFIDSLQQIDFETTPLADIRQQIGQAASLAQDIPVTPAPVTPDVAPEPTPPTDSAPVTPEPIAEVDAIADPVVPDVAPEPVIDAPDVTGVSSAALFENTSDGTLISGAGRSRMEGLRSATGATFQTLSSGDRQSILGSKKGKSARETINKLLNAEPPLTSGATTQLQEAVTYLEGEIARKKPVTPAEGDSLQTIKDTPESLGSIASKTTDESSTFGQGAVRDRLSVPEGNMDLLVRADGSASVLELVVNESDRGKGIGTQLQKAAQEKYPELQGQVSSKAAATNAYRLGRRPIDKPDATLDDVFSAIDEFSSVNLVTPAFQASLDGESSNLDIRQSRTTAPAANIKKTQGSTGSARAPLSTGLLPDTESGSQQTQSFSTQGVQGVVNKITKTWKKVPKIQIVESTDALPDNVRPTDGALLGGVTDGATAYLVADQLTSEAQIESVLTEELFHKGLAKSLGGNYDPILARVFKKRGGVKGLLKLATKYNLPSSFLTNYQDVIASAQKGDREAQLELTDEIMARVAQSPDLPSGLKADIKTIVAKIKRYLKQFLPDAWFDTVTDADLLLMIREANAAGREEGSSVNRVRQSRVQPGDYRGVNDAGERVIFNYLDNSERPETTASQDSIGVARGYWDAVLNHKRSDGVGQKIYRSKVWQGIQQRLSDAKIGLARVENEYKQLGESDVGDIFNAVNNLDLPPLLSNIVSNLNPSLQKSFMSVHSAVSTYSSQADYAAKLDLKVNEAGETLFKVMERNNDAYRAYAAALKLSPTAAKQSITRYLNAQHAQERNQIAWIKNGPISEEGNALRKEVMAELNAGNLTHKQALDQMATLMETYGEGDLAAFKGSGMTDAEAQQIITQMEGVADAKPLLEQAAQATYDVIAATNEIKKQTGSYSNSFAEAVEAYGWKNYVPLRGQGVDLDDADDTFTTHYADNVFASTYRPFQGRESLTEDVFENVQQIAVSAVEQYAAQDFIKKIAVHAVASNQTAEYQSAFEKDGFNGKLLAGDVQQMEINSKEFKQLMATKDRNRLIYYDPANKDKPLQEALVITLQDSRGTDAVLGAKSTGADRLDNLLRQSFTINGVGIADVTQATASLKTWRNPAFIPFDALRNTLTLGYVSATEGGLQGFKQYVNTFTEPGLANYGKDIMAYTRLYGTNQFDKIQELVAKEGEGSTIFELDEFFRLGGPTTQLAALRDTPPGSIESLTKFGGIGDKGLLKKMDSVLMPLNAAADTLSRFAFYKSLLDQGVPKDVAAGRAKNTANFEQRGTWSGPMGAAFEFARATSVGASALINSTLTGEYGKETAAFAFGSGVMMYMAASMFAGADDEGDDNQGKINGKLFNNNFVVQYGDDNSDRLQFGLGFGPIAASMSAGMQAARWMLGHQSMKDSFDNITSGIANQYQVMPTSGISPLTDPISFLANTAVPSILKPVYEVSVNMSGLGIPVRSDYPGAGSGDMTESFGGRYNSEQEMYEQITQALSNGGLFEANPDDLKHVMRAYGGTMTHLIESAFENIKYATRDEDYAYNKKAGFYLVRNFMGSEFSQAPSDFYEHYGRVADLDERVKGFEARGEIEKAEAITDSEFYSDNIDGYTAAKKELLGINKEHKEVFRLGTTPLSEKRNTQKIRDAQRLGVMKSYLEDARN